MKQTEPLFLYTSKATSFLLIPGLIFIIGGILLGSVGLHTESWELTGIGAFVTLLFSVMTAPTFKRVLSDKPYIVITEEALIIHQPFKRSVPINWHHIRGFEMITAQMNKLIFVILENEEAYQKQMAKRFLFFKKPRKVMGLSPIWIVWRQVKRKDREALVRALDRLSSNDSIIFEPLSEQLNKERKERAAYKQLNGTYFLKAYGYSSLITIAAIFFQHLEDGRIHLPILIVSFFLFPFAKALFDVIIGFNINFLLKKETIVDQFLFPLMMLFYGLLYMFSVYIAPFGILYLILKALYRFFKRTWN